MLAALHYRLSDTGMPEAGILQLERAVPLYALRLFVLCMFCHGELARRKPAPLFLTRFFLMVSLGGAAGGAAVGVLAPVVSNWYWELPVALSLAALLALTLTRGLWRLLALASVIGCLAAFFQYARGISQKKGPNQMCPPGHAPSPAQRLWSRDRCRGYRPSRLASPPGSQLDCACQSSL